MEQYNEELKKKEEKAKELKQEKERELEKQKAKEQEKKVEEKKPEEPKSAEKKHIPVVYHYEDEKLVPETDKKVSDISTYNGGSTDKYKWSQSVTDVTFSLNIP